MTKPIIITHPLVQDKLSIMRNKDTSSGMFRMLMSEITELLAYEATRDLPTYEAEIETPMKIKAKFLMIKSKDVALVAILRAGTGMLDGVLKLIPSAPVGFIGLYRDPQNFSVVEYYFKMPTALDTKQVIIVDPILATGNSAVAAVARVKECGAKSIIFICLVASPEGLAYFESSHPDVTLYTSAIDEKLDEKNYILPGLGDAGDRMFGII